MNDIDFKQQILDTKSDSFCAINKEYWLREFSIYRYNNLVYLRTLKCASSYYSKFFKTNGWTADTANNIDWKNDHVFSFIMNPEERRLKGLTEFVAANSQQQLLDCDFIFWGGVLYLDMHAVPYSISYGKYVDKIDWIPIDLNHQAGSANNLLAVLLSNYNLQYEFPEFKEHESSQEKLKIYEMIKEKTKNGNFAMHLGLENDIELYHDVCTNIKPWLIYNNIWKDISWLSQ